MEQNKITEEVAKEYNDLNYQLSQLPLDTDMDFNNNYDTVEEIGERKEQLEDFYGRDNLEAAVENLEDKISESEKIDMASNSNDQSELSALANSESDNVKEAVANNESTSEDTLGKLAESDNEYIQQAVANNESTSKDTLGKLAESDNENIREIVANNNSTSEETLKKLSEDNNEIVQYYANQNLNSREQVEDKSVDQADKQIEKDIEAYNAERDSGKSMEESINNVMKGEVSEKTETKENLVNSDNTKDQSTEN